MYKALGKMGAMSPRWNNLATLALILAGSLIQPIGVRAQSGAGSIQGTIQDATSAVLPGSAVNVVNQKTGVTNNTTANSAGL